MEMLEENGQKAIEEDESGREVSSGGEWVRRGQGQVSELHGASRGGAAGGRRVVAENLGRAQGGRIGRGGGEGCQQTRRRLTLISTAKDGTDADDLWTRRQSVGVWESDGTRYRGSQWAK